jgi:hypothetical protein
VVKELCCRVQSIRLLIGQERFHSKGFGSCVQNGAGTVYIDYFKFHLTFLKVTRGNMKFPFQSFRLIYNTRKLKFQNEVGSC